MFCVRQKVRIAPIDTAYTDNRCWHDSYDPGSVIYDDDPDFKEPPKGEEWEEFGYVDQWEVKMVSFTEEGAKEYLRQNGHNLEKTEIYVESFNRCPEMVAIREFLMGYAKERKEGGVHD